MSVENSPESSTSLTISEDSNSGQRSDSQTKQSEEADPTDIDNLSLYGTVPPRGAEDAGPPTHCCQRLSEQLVDYLHSNDAFETQEECDRRLEATELYNTVLQEWIQRVYEQDGKNRADARRAGARIVTFGSVRLGVNLSDGDVDLLFLGPRHLDRNRDVFGLPHTRTGERARPENVLVEMLRRHEQFESVLAISDAFVPVVKVTALGVQLDCVFALLDSDVIPKDLDVLDDNVLINVDAASQRSINGVRVSDWILRAVPHVENFRTVLRAVKLWARRRCICSNIVGYLGGVSWTIMTAKVCMMHPTLEPCDLLWRFLQLYRFWRWPQPIMLRQPEPDVLDLGFRVWNPELYPADRRHVLPVLTPLYPSMNTTHNVCFSTFNIIRHEIARGWNMMPVVFHDLEATMSSEGEAHNAWGPLFEEAEFFRQYRHYLQIDVSAVDNAVQMRWKGLVEARLRHLLHVLEYIPLLQACLHPYDYTSILMNKTGVCNTAFFIGLDFQAASMGSMTSLPEMYAQISTAMLSWVGRDLEWQMDPETMFVTFQVLKRRELPTLIVDGQVSNGHRRHRHGRARRKQRYTKRVESDSTGASSLSASIGQRDKLSVNDPNQPASVHS